MSSPSPSPVGVKVGPSRVPFFHRINETRLKDCPGNNCLCHRTKNLFDKYVGFFVDKWYPVWLSGKEGRKKRTPLHNTYDSYPRSVVHSLYGYNLNRTKAKELYVKKDRSSKTICTFRDNFDVDEPMSVDQQLRVLTLNEFINAELIDLNDLQRFMVILDFVLHVLTNGSNIQNIHKAFFYSDLYTVLIEHLRKVADGENNFRLPVSRTYGVELSVSCVPTTFAMVHPELLYSSSVHSNDRDDSDLHSANFRDHDDLRKFQLECEGIFLERSWECTGKWLFRTFFPRAIHESLQSSLSATSCFSPHISDTYLNSELHGGKDLKDAVMVPMLMLGCLYHMLYASKEAMKHSACVMGFTDMQRLYITLKNLCNRRENQVQTLGIVKEGEDTIQCSLFMEFKLKDVPQLATEVRTCQRVHSSGCNDHHRFLNKGWTPGPDTMDKKCFFGMRCIELKEDGSVYQSNLTSYEEVKLRYLYVYVLENAFVYSDGSEVDGYFDKDNLNFEHPLPKMEGASCKHMSYSAFTTLYTFADFRKCFIELCRRDIRALELLSFSLTMVYYAIICEIYFSEILAFNKEQYAALVMSFLTKLHQKELQLPERCPDCEAVEMEDEGVIEGEDEA